MNQQWKYVPVQKHRVENKLHTNTLWALKLPTTKNYIYIPKKCLKLSQSGKNYNLALLDDMELLIFSYNQETKIKMPMQIYSGKKTYELYLNEWNDKVSSLQKTYKFYKKNKNGQ